MPLYKQTRRSARRYSSQSVDDDVRSEAAVVWRPGSSRTTEPSEETTVMMSQTSTEVSWTQVSVSDWTQTSLDSSLSLKFRL